MSEAKLALGDNYTLMDKSSYYSGFDTPNDEWVWGVYNDASETIWYYGWQLYMACNGYYAQNGINVCISRSFIEQFPDTDIRKGLFLTEKTFLNEGEKFTDVVNANEGQTTGAFLSDDTYYKANAYVKATVPEAVEQNFAYASLKFQATGQPAVGCQPIIRNSELLLIVAEAAYYEGCDRQTVAGCFE